MKNPLRTGTMIAIAAAGLFASACSKKDDAGQAKPAAAEKTAANIHCDGANDCSFHDSRSSYRIFCVCRMRRFNNILRDSLDCILKTISYL